MVVASRGCKSICCGIFDVCRYCGVFPFRATHTKINRVLPNLFASVVLILACLYVATWHWNEHLRFIYKIHHEKAVQKVLVLPYLGLALTPLVSIIWMTLRIKKFSKIVQALLKIEHVTFFYPKNMNYYMLCLMIATQVVILFYGSYHFGLPYYQSPIMYMYHVFYLLSLLITLQFTAILVCIRGHYNYLLTTLDKNNAEMWTKCHEVLGSCCNAISECYAPPLLVFFLSTFVLTVCNVFVIVLRIKGQDTSGIMFYVLCAGVPSYVIWYILFNCRDSLMKAKKFDKLLYRMIINDDSKVLLRNKRIQIHFKGKRKEEFSAMGFFNFDYPLICSMVCSATTYIVILVQFS